MDDIRTLLALMPKPVPAIVMAVLYRPRDKLSQLRDVLALKSGISIVAARKSERLEEGVCTSANLTAISP